MIRGIHFPGPVLIPILLLLPGLLLLLRLTLVFVLVLFCRGPVLVVKRVFGMVVLSSFAAYSRQDLIGELAVSVSF